MAVILVVNYGYAYIGIGALNGYIIAIIVVQLGTRYCYWCLLDWKIVKTVLSYLNIVHLKWQMKRNGRATNGKGNETKWNRSRKQNGSWKFNAALETDTYLGWCWRTVTTHPMTPKVVHHAREGRVPTLGDGHVLQRNHKVRLEGAHWGDFVRNGKIFISIDISMKRRHWLNN